MRTGLVKLGASSMVWGGITNPRLTAGGGRHHLGLGGDPSVQKGPIDCNKYTKRGLLMGSMVLPFYIGYRMRVKTIQTPIILSTVNWMQWLQGGERLQVWDKPHWIKKGLNTLKSKSWSL